MIGYWVKMTLQSDDNSEQPVSLKKRAAKGAVWISAEVIGVQVSSFVVFATMAHFIEPRDFGLIGICFLAIQSLQMLVLYNVGTAVTRKNSATDDEYTTAFWLMVALSVLAFLLLQIGAGWAERLFQAQGLEPVLRSMSFIILFMGLSRTHEAWLTRNFHFRSLALRAIVGAVIGGCVGVVMAVKGFGVNALVVQQIVTPLVSTLLLWLVCEWRPTLTFSLPVAAEIMHYLRSTATNSLLNTINQNCDTFLIAYFFGPANVGIYNVAKRIRLALQLVTGDPIKNMSLPMLAEMQTDEERLRRGFLKTLTFLCVMCAPVFLGTSAVAHEAITLIFGQKWMQAVPVLEWLAFGGFAMVVLVYNDAVFIVKRKQGWCVYITASYAVLAIIIAIICYYIHCGIYALPFVLPYIAVVPLAFGLSSRLLSLPVSRIFFAMMPGLSSSIFMWFVVRYVAQQMQSYGDLTRLMMMGGVGVLTYVAVMGIVWRDVTRQIMDILRHMVRR